MANFNIKIEGLTELLAGIGNAKSAMGDLLYQAMGKAVAMIQTDAREIKEGSFKNQTGTLRRSITAQVDSAARGMVYVSSDAPYGEYVEFGSGPHTIVPVNAKALAFKGPTGTVFAMRVNHPGSKPYPFMEPAFENQAPLIQDMYHDLTDKIVTMMAEK